MSHCLMELFFAGHTADSSSYVIEGLGIFCGDTLFYPDKVSKLFIPREPILISRKKNSKGNCAMRFSQWLC